MYMDWGIAGHEWAVDLLREHVAQDRMRHAYLITGSQGVGRRTLALRLAQAVNCDQPPASGLPCFKCRSCEKIEHMTHPDLAIVEAERIGGTLKVDQVRELQRNLMLTPYEARYRVAILLRFEEAHPSAANALLKTLEEPPPKVILILTASSVEDLLPTVVSRCEVLRLRSLALNEVSQWLEYDWDVGSDEANLLAHISGGIPGYALRLHKKPELMEKRLIWLKEHQRLISSGRVDRFEYIAPLISPKNPSKTRTELRDRFLIWISLWRDVLHKAIGASAPISNLDHADMIAGLVEAFGEDNARSMVSALQRTLILIDKNVNARLAAEVLMLDLPYQKVDPSTDDTFFQGQTG
jgi:DNA polymerase-3 subunit delta'